MTGQYAHQNGLMGLVNCGWSMPEKTRTIVDEFNDAGYETVHCGMQHERSSDDKNRYSIGMSGKTDDKYPLNTESAYRQALVYLESRNREKPFYMNIGCHEVHCTNWMNRVSYNSERRSWYGSENPQTIVLPDWVPDFPALRDEYASFYACISWFDHQTGKFLKALDKLGVFEDTMVIFTTDHGIASNRAKTTLYDRGTETALMIHYPGASAQTHGELIQNIDLAPTILDACGLPVPARMAGRSFLPLMTGQDYKPHPHIITERNFHGGTPWNEELTPGSDSGYDPTRAVKTERYHYIRYFKDDIPRMWHKDEITYTNDTYTDWFDELLPPQTESRPAEELFDIELDCQERFNLASNPEYKPVLDEMRGILESWMSNTDDPLLYGDIPDRLNGWENNE